MGRVNGIFLAKDVHKVFRIVNLCVVCVPAHFLEGFSGDLAPLGVGDDAP
jgi:hypothetical protein